MKDAPCVIQYGEQVMISGMIYVIAIVVDLTKDVTPWEEVGEAITNLIVNVK